MAIADSFKVLSEPLRRQILELLKGGRMSAGELAIALNVSPAALSYHLRLLKEAELVIEYKEKNYVYYSLNMTVFDFGSQPSTYWVRFNFVSYELHVEIGKSTTFFPFTQKLHYLV